MRKARRRNKLRFVSTKKWLKRRGYKKCALCGSRRDLTIDHIIPLSKGGADRNRNKQCLCATCNRKKGALLMKLGTPIWGRCTACQHEWETPVTVPLRLDRVAKKFRAVAELGCPSCGSDGDTVCISERSVSEVGAT